MVVAVDPAILKETSAALDGAATEIGGQQIAKNVASVAAALPGSLLAGACSGADDEGLTLRVVASRVRHMAALMRGGANNYQMQDGTLASGFRQMGEL